MEISTAKELRREISTAKELRREIRKPGDVFGWVGVSIEDGLYAKLDKSNLLLAMAYLPPDEPVNATHRDGALYIN